MTSLLALRMETARRGRTKEKQNRSVARLSTTWRRERAIQTLSVVSVKEDYAATPDRLTAACFPLDGRSLPPPSPEALFFGGEIRSTKLHVFDRAELLLLPRNFFSGR